jgi:cytochrome b561
MATRTTDSARYTGVAMWLHWLIALAILYNLASGLLRPVMPPGFFVFHVSSGITILTLSIARVVWRLTHKPPPFLPMKAWEARTAHVVHFLLYVAMVLLPFSGWALLSANPPVGSPGAAAANAERVARGQQPRSGKPMMVWSVVPLPMIGAVAELGRSPEGLAEQRAVHERIETFHLLGGWVLLALLFLHIGGALKHQFADKEPELARMGLGSAGRRRG